MQTESTRVIILGAGPAGLSAARGAINRRKVSEILVIDQGKHQSPTYSACLEHLEKEPLMTGGLGGSTSGGWGAQLGMLSRNDLENWRRFLLQVGHSEAEVSDLISGTIKMSGELLRFCKVDLDVSTKSQIVNSDTLKKHSVRPVCTVYPPDASISRVFNDVITNSKLVFKQSRITSIDFNDDATVLLFENGEKIDASNDLVVIALGCVETTSLFLKSFSKNANQNKIEAPIRDHPSTYLFTFKVPMFKKLSKEFYRQPSVKHKFELELKPIRQVFRSGFFEFQEIDNQVIENGSLVRNLDNGSMRSVAILRKVLRRILPKSIFSYLLSIEFVVWAQIEQERSSENFLFLDDEKVCSSWRLRKQDLDDFGKILEISKRCVLELGGVICTQIELDSLVQIPNHKVQAAHPSGTLQIHSDPNRGLLNMWGQVRGNKNLIVASSAVFPSDGWINPTLTIMAYSALVTEKALE